MAIHQGRPSKMQESISTIVMAYNEAPTLRQAVEEALNALGKTGRSYELIIIDDGSTDGMSEIADQLAMADNCVRVVHHERNQGMGGVYRTAFKEVKNDIIYFMAADLQPIPLLYFERFLPLLEQHDLVLGYQTKRDAPLQSKFFSWAEKLIFQIIFPGVPKISGPLMFRRTLLDDIKLTSMDSDDRSWIVLWELMIRAHRNGYRFTSVPVQRRQRAQGKSKGNTWRNAFWQLRAAFGLWKFLKR
jgi:dolichol-phosphate mannosyltransferase